MAAQLSKSSQNVLSIFEKTKRKLQSLNDRIDSENVVIDDKINILSNQKSLLASAQQRNNKVIENLDKII